MYLTKTLILLFALSAFVVAQDEGDAGAKPAEPAKAAEPAKPADGAAWSPPTEPLCSVDWAEVKCAKGDERIRKAWRARSPEYKKLYIQAAVFLQQRKDGDKPSIHDLLAKIHGDNSQAVPSQKIRKGGVIHSGPHFLPWHRYFVWIYENHLRKCNPSLTNSYWSWGLDAQAPELADIWKDEHFGGNGMGDEACVLSGPFAKWQPMYPTPHCLKRNWSQGDCIGPLESLAVTNLKLTSAQNYELVRRAIEMVPHGSVHNNIGGDSLTMYSPNEPTFFLYHTNIDRLWHTWQHNFPTRVPYNGYHSHNRKKADFSEQLHAFPSKVTAGDVMKISSLCVKYEELTQADVKHPDLPPPNVGSTVAASESKRLLRRFFGPWSHGYTGLQRRSEPKEAAKKEEKKPDKPSANNTPMTTIDGKLAKAPIVKPVDDKVKVRPAEKSIMFAATDRSQLSLNRAVSGMPADWLAANGLEEVEARTHEALGLNCTENLNKIPGYFTPSSLYKRPDMLLKLIKDPKVNQLCCAVNGTNVCVEKGKNAATDPEQCLSNLLERLKRSVKGSLEKPIASILVSVIKVAGVPLTTNPKSISTPFAVAKGEKPIVATDPKVLKIVKENPVKPLESRLKAVPEKQVEKTIVIALVQNIRKDEMRIAHAEKTAQVALKKAEDNGIVIPPSATVKQVIEKREAVMEKASEAPKVAKALEKAELVKQTVAQLKAAVQAAAVSKSEAAKEDAKKVREKMNEVVIGKVALADVTVNSKSAPALLKPPTAKPSDKPAEKTEEKHADKPAEKTEEKHADKPAEKKAEEKHADKPAEKTEEKHADKPAAKTEKYADKPAEEKKAAAPAEEEEEEE